MESRIFIFFITYNGIFMAPGYDLVVERHLSTLDGVLILHHLDNYLVRCFQFRSILSNPLEILCSCDMYRVIEPQSLFLRFSARPPFKKDSSCSKKRYPMQDIKIHSTSILNRKSGRWRKQQQSHRRDSKHKVDDRASRDLMSVKSEEDRSRQRHRDSFQASPDVNQHARIDTGLFTTEEKHETRPREGSGKFLWGAMKAVRYFSYARRFSQHTHTHTHTGFGTNGDSFKEKSRNSGEREKSSVGIGKINGRSSEERWQE